MTAQAALSRQAVAIGLTKTESAAQGGRHCQKEGLDHWIFRD